jgi:putative ABC transport system substrate-binding protein
MRRRDLIAMLGGAAAAWPQTGRAQLAMPVIGWITIRRAAESQSAVAAFRRGLAEEGLEEGRNIRVEYRWAEGHYDRLHGISDEFIRMRPKAIYCIGVAGAEIMKAVAAAGIPVVFSTGVDPVSQGLVESLARPGGNITGVRIFSGTLSAKRLGLLHQLVPRVTSVAVLLNSQRLDESEKADIVKGAQRLDLSVSYYDAANDADIENAFARIAKSPGGALLVAPDPAFLSSRDRIVGHANALALPAIYEVREFAEAGGLISYGDDLSDAYRLIGVQTGKIVNGARPADLPVLQSTKFETVLNLKTAKALGIDVPTLLLASVDEVIE